MKINKSTEQAIFVLIMLALQKEHKPVKSQVLSQILQVSDSYLKKILMKLSKAGLIDASASKQGGYRLKRSIEEISLADVLLALEGETSQPHFAHLGAIVFDDKEHVREGEEKIAQALDQGIDSYYRSLSTFPLVELLHEEAYKLGAIAWENQTK